MTAVKRCCIVLLTLAGAAAPLSAQGIAVSGRIGTLGIGVDGALALGDRLAIRAGANLQPYEPTEEWSDVEFTLDLASPSFMGVLDWHPGGGAFRFTGGAVLFAADTELRGELTGSVEIGNGTYTPQQIGTLTGVFDTRALAPYLGLGFGKAPGRAGFAFALDLGVAFHGEPGVTLSATGPLASDPAFRADLAREEGNIEEDARAFRVYPVLSIGLAFGF